MISKKKVYFISLCFFMFMLFGCGTKNEVEQQSEVVESVEIVESQDEVNTFEEIVEDAISLDIQLPYLIEDGMLEINSIFQYTGLNVDSQWQDGTDIGAIILINHSTQYLEKMDLSIEMSDGNILHFIVCDIPAGKTVWAFDVDNKNLETGSYIKDIQSETSFVEDTGIVSAELGMTVSGVEISLKNNMMTDVKELTVYCHNKLDDVYFGGTSYQYTLESLMAGEEMRLIAVDCLLGETEVTRMLF